MNKESKILLIIGAMVIAGGILLALDNHKQASVAGERVDQTVLVRPESHRAGGPAGAKVELVEFADYQCPACGFAYLVIKEVLAHYQDNNQVSYVYRHFPLVSIHSNALLAANAAEAAGAEGKFWEMHDLLYINQQQWSSSEPLMIFLGYAQELGLDIAKFEQALQTNKFQEVIQADVNDGNKLRINATPTFYLNGQKLPDLPTLEELLQKIDTELQN